MINTIPSRGSSSRREIMTYDQFELWVSHNAVVERTFSEVFHEAEWAEPNANRGGRKEGVSTIKIRHSAVDQNEANIFREKCGRIKDPNIIWIRKK